VSARRPTWLREPRAADALLALAAALAAAGAALALWRPDPRVPDMPNAVPPAPPAAVAPVAPVADAALEEAVARTNVFSASRTPPRVRYVPPEAGSEAGEVGMSPGAGLAPDVAAPPASPRGPDDAPQFYGTVIGPGGARALLRLDDRVPGAQLYAAGERAGGWRVVRVEADRVVLAGGGGRVTLRLPRPGRPRAADSIPPDSTPRAPDSLATQGSP
jgi:hypothetical protein